MVRFRLWLNRNFFKIILVVLGILLLNYFTSSLDSYYEKRRKRTQELLKSTQIEDSSDEETINNLEITSLENSSEEYIKVKQAVQKITTAICEADNNENNEKLKQCVYNMLTDSFIKEQSENTDEPISVQNVLDFIVYIENIENYFLVEIR